MPKPITADYEKIRTISNSLFGASPIQLPLTTSKRLAEQHAQSVLASYRSACRKALIKKGLIAVTGLVLMSAAAFAQDGMSCVNLRMTHQVACRTTLAGETTYTMSEEDASHSAIHIVPESEYDAAVKANTEATLTLAAMLHADNVRADAIAKYGKRYYEKALSCVDNGGKWSETRHTCKAAR